MSCEVPQAIVTFDRLVSKDMTAAVGSGRYAMTRAAAYAGSTFVVEQRLSL